MSSSAKTRYSVSVSGEGYTNLYVTVTVDGQQLLTDPMRRGGTGL